MYISWVVFYLFCVNVTVLCNFFAMCLFQAQVDPAAAVSSGYVVLSADATQQSGFYTPQDAQPYPLVTTLL